MRYLNAHALVSRRHFWVFSYHCSYLTSHWLVCLQTKILCVCKHSKLTRVCPHLGVLVYISKTTKTMSSLHPRWLAGLSPLPLLGQLLWHQQYYKHKSPFVDPHSIASINPHISHTGPARRLCLFKLRGLFFFYTENECAYTTILWCYSTPRTIYIAAEMLCHHWTHCLT